MPQAPAPRRIPVDHRVKGEQVKYWRELRASKAVRWETFPHFPLVLNANGSPWPPACMWLLDRARARPHKVSSLNPVVQGLRAYKQFLDEFGLQWDDFSAVDKLLRPTYLYKTHLQDLINAGAIEHSTASGACRRWRAFIGSYWRASGSASTPRMPLGSIGPSALKSSMARALSRSSR